MVFCNFNVAGLSDRLVDVTILILIDGFLQLVSDLKISRLKERHNPYFNRWFSAIPIHKNMGTTHRRVTILILIDGFLQWQFMPVSKS